MRLTKHIISRSLIQALTLVFFCHASHGEIYEVKSLDFGSIAVVSNASIGTVRISHTGIISSSSSVLIISPPEIGEFQLVNFPANQRLSVSAESLLPNTTSTRYSAEQFSLTDIDVPSLIISDASGSATLPVGGTLSTSGSGSNTYVDTDYRIRYQITINY